MGMRSGPGGQNARMYVHLRVATLTIRQQSLLREQAEAECEKAGLIGGLHALCMRLDFEAFFFFLQPFLSILLLLYVIPKLRVNSFNLFSKIKILFNFLKLLYMLIA